jgi:uncharacterized protein (TIGR00661 family)
MKDCSIIIQGEGKGHFSQALQSIRQLKKEGFSIKGVYIGKSISRSHPDYFKEIDGIPLKKFLSPNFILKSNQRGIQVSISILLNIIFSPIFLISVCKLGILLKRDRSSMILNFYDPIGLLASSCFKRKAKRIVLSHHFYLSHIDFIHPHGMEKSYFWLQFMNNFMMRFASEVIAFSFRKGTQYGKIGLAPPLIDERIKLLANENKDRDLCYFLNDGFLEEILTYYRNHQELKADIYTDFQIREGVPANVLLHPVSRNSFIKDLSRCSRVICSAGFDLVAEAFYLGKPVFVIPAENHYEQYCNAIDASRTGMSYQLDSLKDLEDLDFKAENNNNYIEWISNSSISFRTISIS